MGRGKKNSFVHWLFAGFFLFWGIYYLISGLLLFFEARSSAHWPQTPGEIVESSVKTRMTRGSSLRHGGTGSYRVWWPVLRYSYAAEGVPHSATRLSYGVETNETMDRNKAESVARKYPLGKKVTVYYDPARPGRATLIAGTSELGLVKPGFGLFMIGVGSLISWLTWKKKLK